MSNSRVTLTLSRTDRELIRQYGYPFPGVKAALGAVPKTRNVVKVKCDRYEVELLLGDLARSINHCSDEVLQLDLNDLYEEIESDTN